MEKAKMNVALATGIAQEMLLLPLNYYYCCCYITELHRLFLLQTLSRTETTCEPKVFNFVLDERFQQMW